MITFITKSYYYCIHNINMFKPSFQVTFMVVHIIHVLALGQGTEVLVTLHTTQSACLAVALDTDNVVLVAAAVSCTILSES